MANTNQPGALSEQKALIAVVALAAVAIFPLSYSLPFSERALVVAVAIPAALNILTLSLVAGRAYQILLQIMNIVMIGSCLLLAFRGGAAGVAEGAVLLAIASTLFVLAIVAGPRIKLAASRHLFVTQQVVLACTLTSWVLLDPVRPTLAEDALFLSDHFRMGLRFLFAGPLALLVVVFAAQLFTWTTPLKVLLGVCIAQYGIGLLEVGSRLQRPEVAATGAILCGAYLAWLVLLSARFLLRKVSRG